MIPWAKMEQDSKGAFSKIEFEQGTSRNNTEPWNLLILETNWKMSVLISWLAFNLPYAGGWDKYHPPVIPAMIRAEVLEPIAPSFPFICFYVRTKINSAGHKDHPCNIPATWRHPSKSSQLRAAQCKDGCRKVSDWVYPQASKELKCKKENLLKNCSCIIQGRNKTGRLEKIA